MAVPTGLREPAHREREPADPDWERESDARIYCRQFPAVFSTGRGHLLFSEDGRAYVDLLAGAGSLNYGHNHPHIKSRVLEYLAGDGIVHGLDLHTAAKRELIDRFTAVVLEPRGLDHRLLFPGPTGTTAMETALRIARRATGRSPVVAFTNAFHGLSLGSLAATANRAKREGAGLALHDVVRLPYDGFLGDADTIEVAERMLSTPGAGIEPPAAFVVETVQGEGGLAAAGRSWLERLAALARDLGALLVVDDIQAGCGRTGSFFSFDGTDVVPDVVCLSKSLSGIGLPLALVLVRPHADVLLPGQHGGTFRGNNLGFVGASAALDLWTDPGFTAGVGTLCTRLEAALQALPAPAALGGVAVRGRGLLRGLAWEDPTVAGRVSAAAFERGLLVEVSGPRREVLKLLPPLVMPADDLGAALAVLGSSIEAVARGTA